MPNPTQDHGDTLKLTPGESVQIVSSAADRLVVEATYAAAGDPPPKHLHPSQDEHFEVLEGALNVRVNGDERTLEAGETINIGRGISHQMWNASEMPAPLSFARIAAGYEDTFRLAIGPDLVSRGAIRALALVGRIRGA